MKRMVDIDDLLSFISNYHIDDSIKPIYKEFLEGIFNKYVELRTPNFSIGEKVKFFIYPDICIEGKIIDIWVDRIEVQGKRNDSIIHTRIFNNSDIGNKIIKL